LDAMSQEELEELVVEAWLSRAPKRLASQYIEEHLSGRSDNPVAT